MFVTDLEGNSNNWKIRGKEVTLDRRPRSKLHVKAREILKERFPTHQILEEVPVKVRRRKTLYFDFFLPLRKLVIEVHGEQHFGFNSMYHSSIQDFIQQTKNDNDKEEWCEINGIDFVVFSYDNVDNWKEQV